MSESEAEADEKPKADADAADTAADSADEAVEAADATDTSAADAADADAADSDAAANVAVAVEGVTGKGKVTSPKNKEKREKPPDGLIWASLHNSKATESRLKHVKVLVPKDLNVTEIRRFTCGKVGCPFREFQLEIDGKQMWAGREQPFLNVECECRVKWRRVNRLARLMQQKKIGGINGLCRQNGRTVLHHIALNGDVELFREVLNDPNADDNLINVRDKLGDTALTLASITGYIEIASACLEQEADVEVHNGKGRTALLLAAEHGHSDVVQSLLMMKAKLDPGKGTTCPSAMYLAQLNQRDGVVKTILRYLKDNEGDDEW